MNRITALLASGAVVAVAGLSAAAPAMAATAAPARPATVIPAPGDVIFLEVTGALQITTHGSGAQLTIENYGSGGNGTQFYTTDATGGGQKIHVHNSVNCWDLNGAAVIVDACQQGDGQQVFTFSGGSGLDNWLIRDSSGDDVEVSNNVGGKPLWTDLNGSLARWGI